jgi:hypothetical protein
MSTVRVSGTRSTTPSGNYGISAPGGNVTLGGGGNITITGGGNITVNAGTGTTVINSTQTNISGNATVGGNAIITGTLTVLGDTATNIHILPAPKNVGSPPNPFGQDDNVYIGPGYVPFGGANGTYQRTLAQLYLAGGVGIEKDLNVGGYIYGRVSQATTSQQLIVTATNINQVFYPTFTDQLGVGTYLYGDNIGLKGGLTYNPSTGILTTDQAAIVAATPSTSPETGALTVAGGAGIVGEVNLGNNLNVLGNIASANIYPNADNQFKIGEATARWEQAYLEKIYTNVITSNPGENIEIRPEVPMTDIFSDIRVRGKNPIGTAPVVTNVLYVTVDGDDTNDGRAMDASRACRTIGGAINSPYYQSGTQIRVSPGLYLENNPLEMKPYTSVMGSDLRTTFVEPINKTQDLFHVNSGCYLAFMNFLNGRSGLLEGQYTAGTNRGAYATAFPPLTGNNRIDLFHSPYIQNCTNQSGPWLKDGTLFVPNQTIQVPDAVGISSWDANTSTILVTLSTGTVELGMSLEVTEQDPGFFDARTLLLANKPFLQEQVVAFVDQTFNTGTFVYNQTKCARDTGLIVDSIALDLMYSTVYNHSASESTFAGLQYWSQDVGRTGAIQGELTTTTEAINYARDLVISLVQSVNAYSVTGTIATLFNTVTNILNNGTIGVTDQIVSNNLTTSTDAATWAAYKAIQANTATIQLMAVNYIYNKYPAFEFNTSTCYRDIGYIINSVSFDLLNGGNKQSIKSGVYYWGYDGASSAIPREIPETTAAYNFIKSIIPNIVLGQPILTPYQGTYPQVYQGYNASTQEAVRLLQDGIDTITNIIRNGPSAAGPQYPMPVDRSPVISIQNACALLQANRQFIVAETIAYINATAGKFNYSREFCYRDVGILVENMSYDMAFGGNQKSVESGLAYWNGAVSKIAGQESQTTSAIDYLGSLCKQVVVNQTCIDLLSNLGVTSALNSQVRNTVLTGGSVAVGVITNLFNIVTDIIANGPSVAPQIYVGSNPDEAYISAEILLQANRQFIQEDTINWINTTFQSFGYNKIKCRRDLGLIIDSVAFDLLYPTEGHSQSTFAGLQYYKQHSGDHRIRAWAQVSAMYYLRDLCVKIIQNITPADDLVPRYSTGTQTTIANCGTPVEAKFIYDEFTNIATIVKRNDGKWTDRIIPNGYPTDIQSAYNTVKILNANKNYIAKELIAFTDATQPGFQYSKTKCIRDTSYLIDAVCFDLIHGGNRQAVQNAQYYYWFNTSTTVIPYEKTQTIDAFHHLAIIAGQVVQNIPVSYLQTAVPQVFGITSATVVEANTLGASISTITNIIQLGSKTAYAPTPIANTATQTTATTAAFDLLLKNKKFLTEEVIAYIDQQYNSTPFTYNKAKCSRDTGLIVDSLVTDLQFNSFSESNFAGLQYWSQNGYTGRIASEITTITNAIRYLKTIMSTVANNSSANGPYSALLIQNDFDVITNILSNANGVVSFVTDQIVSNRTTIDPNPGVLPALQAIQAAKPSLQQQVLDYIQSPSGLNYSASNFNTGTRYRDVGYIIDSVCVDLVYGGNKQAVKSGLYYYYNDPTMSDIPGEVQQTTAAYDFIGSLLPYIIKSIPVARRFQSTATQVLALSASPGTDAEVTALSNRIELITQIIQNGPDSALPKTPLGLTATTSANVLNAIRLLADNKTFIKAEVIAFIDATFSQNKSFQYNQELCYRDTGLIVDAVSQDLLLGGNQKSTEAGLAYWNKGYNSVAGQESTTTMAINYARDLALKIAANEPVYPNTLTETTQVINPFFQYGGDYMPQQSIRRNFGIVTDIITRGPQFAPPIYAGGGIFALTGPNGSSVNFAPKVVAVNTVTTGTYLISLSTSTIGYGDNHTIYFGKTSVYPIQDTGVEQLSYALTGSVNTYNRRKLDPIGSMGGSLVDGGVISDRSPIQSFVYDAFTQINQGGRGIHITNNGYAQLVSVFTVFCSIGVQVDNGGIASIVNSNANFGDLCLVAKGYGSRSFSGTVYNPPYTAYPSTPGPNGFNQYYPEGYWPHRGQVEIFVPDTANRPHISLVMEVVPPESYNNPLNTEKLAATGLVVKGFKNSQPSTSTIHTGTITLTGVDTTDIAIGNNVYILDQFGYPYDPFPWVHDEFGQALDVGGNVIPTDSINTQTNAAYRVFYASTGTYVTDLNYNSITLSQAVTSGAIYPNNPNYFTLYFCGNAYYTVQSSSTATNPKPVGLNILSAAGLQYRDPFTAALVSPPDQVQLHARSLQHLNSLVNSVISNATITPVFQTDIPQFSSALVQGGNQAIPFINQRFSNLLNIITATNVVQAQSIVPSRAITQTGTVPAGAGSAVILIRDNIDFLAAEVSAYVIDPAGLNFASSNFNVAKCQRDVKIILQALIYDIESGGSYNMVYSGLSYWSRNGTHHIVELGEAVNDFTLFPDGATVNFYQRSYISASGYVFEYVGAGTNYGALPQVGRADPDQLKETVQLGTGKVFFTSTDQNGDFRIGPGLVISQATGVLSGRTFTKSLFANMTPFMLAIGVG